MFSIPGSTAVSPFPPPPEYSHNYGKPETSRPPPPPQNEFTVFGEEYRLDEDVIRPLSTQNIKQLYSAKNDWKSEMKKLNRSTLAAFADLLDILIRSPDHPDRQDKINDLQALFINMHHMINEYRPLQARDTLRLMQQEQVRILDEATDRFKAHLKAGQEALREELDLSQLSLRPVPRPSPSIGVLLDSDDEHTDMKQSSATVKIEGVDTNELEDTTIPRIGCKASVLQRRERKKLETKLGD